MSDASFCCFLLNSSLLSSSGGTPSTLPLACTLHSENKTEVDLWSNRIHHRTMVLNVSLTGSASLLCSPARAATFAMCPSFARNLLGKRLVPCAGWGAAAATATTMPGLDAGSTPLGGGDFVVLIGFVLLMLPMGRGARRGSGQLRALEAAMTALQDEGGGV
jgi:hypothetical protein